MAALAIKQTLLSFKELSDRPSEPGVLRGRPLEKKIAWYKDRTWIGRYTGSRSYMGENWT
jgi:hypothetical protein